MCKHQTRLDIGFESDPIPVLKILVLMVFRGSSALEEPQIVPPHRDLHTNVLFADLLFVRTLRKMTFVLSLATGRGMDFALRWYMWLVPALASCDFDFQVCPLRMSPCMGNLQTELAIGAPELVSDLKNWGLRHADKVNQPNALLLCLKLLRL